ncbi:MAG: 5-methyltetrahydrofolate--homocysteine methyltransferase [Alphaproteobacteria bacterium]|nr:5-methyltetrahydrofolate--homocysteine methyltransferase [Alphaproteobacteria bacterium]
MTSEAARRLETAGSACVLVLDGAYGTQFRALKLPEAAFRDASLARHSIPLAGDYEVLNLSLPQVVRGMHDAYLAAGADIIETNTFNANEIIQADFGLAARAVDMARAGASLARAAADAAMASDPSRPRFVAGALGVTRRNPARRGADSPPGITDAGDDELREACVETAGALIEGGVDLLLIETVTSTRNARLAIEAARQAMKGCRGDLPIVASGTIGADGRFESGETIEAFVDALADLDLHALGLNCALSARDLAPHVATLARFAKTRLWLYPNAGYPDAKGHYHETSVETAAALKAIAAQGLLNAVGACCGSTPVHIEALRRAIADLKPRTL